MISPIREQRRIRNRAVSVGLAILIGIIVGVGGWLASDRMMPRTKESQSIVGTTKNTAKNHAPKNMALVKTEPAIVPHKALYQVSLVSSKSGSQVIDIDGRMYYQLHQGCEGYTTDHRFALTYSYADSEPMRIASDFSTLESMDGTSFDFSSRRRRGGELYEELRGHAEGPNRDEGRVAYQEPLDLEYDLPEGTLFPVAHTRALLRAARDGEKFFSSTVFDGSDEEGPVDVAAIVGTSKQSAQRIEKLRADFAAVRTSGQGDELIAAKSYTMRLAFFPRASGAATSDYDLTMQLHENGVISHMVIAYPDFTVEQKLVAIEPMAPEPCNGTTDPKDQASLTPKDSVAEIPKLPLR